MLCLFGFERVAVAISDLYFVDPHPMPGQEGAERGVRLELRMLERGELHGSIYSAQPITVDKPIWRADLLESADGPPASFDRTHHHPQFTDWDPSPRQFVPELSADPVAWVCAKLADLEGVLADAGVDAAQVGPNDAADMRAALPEIEATLRRLLDAVHAGALAAASDPTLTQARLGWL
jgi:hypothetical protein